MFWKPQYPSVFEICFELENMYGDIEMDKGVPYVYYLLIMLDRKIDRIWRICLGMFAIVVVLLVLLIAIELFTHVGTRLQPEVLAARDSSQASGETRTVR